MNEKPKIKCDCTDCVHFSVCYLRKHGKTDNVACDDIELNPWYNEKEKEKDGNNRDRN